MTKEPSLRTMLDIVTGMFDIHERSHFKESVASQPPNDPRRTARPRPLRLEREIIGGACALWGDNEERSSSFINASMALPVEPTGDRYMFFIKRHRSASLWKSLLRTARYSSGCPVRPSCVDKEALGDHPDKIRTTFSLEGIYRSVDVPYRRQVFSSTLPA